MMAIAHVDGSASAGSHPSDDRARNRFAARRAAAAANADVSVQESFARSRAAAEALGHRRRIESSRNEAPTS